MRSLVLALFLVACPKPTPLPAETPMPDDAAAFVHAWEQRAAPVEKDLNLAYWEATTTGSKEAYDRFGALEVAWRELHSDPDEFAHLVRWDEEADLDPTLAREVALLRAGYTENQLDPELREELVSLSVEAESVFNTHRGEVDGARVSSNEIDSVLVSSTDSAERQAYWEASKSVGPEVADTLIRLVEARNRAARDAGFADYYQMRLVLGEQDPAQVEALFDELAQLTDAPFAAIKADIDATLARRYGLSVEELRPWHYNDPYFQELPRTLEVDLDGYYAGRDALAIERRYWAGMGLPVDEILERSDLTAREGKQQAAFCVDMDREGDVRVLANIEDDEYWNGTMLHELGHAVYDTYRDPSLPWLLRAPAHSMTTEAVALLFGRLSKDPAWMGPMLDLSDADLAPVRGELVESQRLLQLVFARWSLVMVNFERGLYADPHQDLQDLWWDLVEQYQGLTRPEGREEMADWATKVHIISSPVYYHNYVMGELLASQLRWAMARDLDDGGSPAELALVSRPEVGQWLRERIFEPGALYPWDELVRRATGEPLSARHWAAEFVHTR